jgi:Cu-processing system permease protein
MSGILTIAWLTLYEARRRRIVLAAFGCGALWLAVYAIGVYFIDRGGPDTTVGAVQRAGQRAFFGIFGLFAVNFLTLAAAVLLPIDTVSGEISSGVIETLASKPVRRADIIIGKWLAHWLLTAAYLVAMGGGVLLIVFAITGYRQPNALPALLLMALGFTTLLTISIAGGTCLSTVTNGIVAFGFYGLGFISGLMEQLGAMAGNRAARDIGTAISLISPADALWRMASFQLQPAIVRDLNLGAIFAMTGVAPTAAMVWWSVGLTLATLWFAIRSFARRPL